MDRTYSLRTNGWSQEITYSQDARGLSWTSTRGGGRLDYAAVRKLRIYKVRYFGSRATYWRCDITADRGRPIRLQAAHWLGRRRIEDRSAAYLPFIKQLESRLAQANPGARFEAGSHWLAVVDTLLGSAFVAALRLAGLVDYRSAANASASLMRAIGPSLKGHRVARSNLVAAFPEKTAAEIDQILQGMWDNLGRVFVEYAHLDGLWDFDPAKVAPGHIVMAQDDRRRFLSAWDTPGPALVFGGHLANWELLLWAIGSRPDETAVVYRRPNIAFIDRELARIRARSKTELIPADAAAVFAVKRVLRGRGAVGAIVDEHFPGGVEVVFFGRRCTTTPIFARLARQFDCPIYGARLVRLPGGRFRVDVTDPLAAPRDADGRIDVAATTQMITSITEGWIREHPEQWLWLLRRWR